MTRRRARSSVPPFAELRSGAALLSALLTPSQYDLNLVRLKTTQLVWKSQVAAVAICPSYDDFLIWTDFRHAPEIAIPMTEEAMEDYRRTVQPALREHGRLSDIVECELRNAVEDWALTICDARRGKEFLATHRFERFLRKQPKRPSLLEVPSVDALQTAHTDVVEALTAFIGRHTPDTEKPAA